MEANENGDEGDSRPSSKVARLIEEYGLGKSYGDELEQLWTADGSDRRSLRELADRFNRDILRVAMEDADLSMVDGEVENYYRLLTDETLSSGMRTEARSRLERSGLDVGRVQTDFVTYQAIRSYLTEYRSAKYDRPDTAERTNTASETVRSLRNRLRSVTQTHLSQLRDEDRIALEEFRLFVDVDVICEECGEQHGVPELLEQGGCDCLLEQ